MTDDDRGALLREAVDTARAVAKSVGDMTAAIEEATHVGRRNRVLIWLLAAVLVVGFGIGLIYTAVQSSHQATAAHNSCVVSNRDRNIVLNHLWIPALTTDGTASQAQTKVLIHDAQRAYAQRKC